MQSVKQEPIYLPGVANNPQPSHYLNLIRTSQSSGRETWNIWYLFAFRPQMTQHLARFTQEVMREPSPLSPGLRELIAAYTSYVNECEFCTKAHVAVAAELLGSEDLVWTGTAQSGCVLFEGRRKSIAPLRRQSDRRPAIHYRR